MIRRGMPLLVVTCFLVGSTGCRTPRGPYKPIARKDGQLPHQLRYGVSMLDENARNALLLVNRTAKKAPGGQIQVRMQMQNIFRDETLWSDVRFVFYDSDQMAIDQSEWQTLAFPPHEVVLVQGNSLRGEAKTWNAQFKDLRSKSGEQLSTPEKVWEDGLWRDSVLPE